MNGALGVNAVIEFEVLLNSGSLNLVGARNNHAPLNGEGPDYAIRAFCFSRSAETRTERKRGCGRSPRPRLSKVRASWIYPQNGGRSTRHAASKWPVVHSGGKLIELSRSCANRARRRLAVLEAGAALVSTACCCPGRTGHRQRDAGGLAACLDRQPLAKRHPRPANGVW